MFNKERCFQSWRLASMIWDGSELERAGMGGCFPSGEQQDGMGALVPSLLCLGGKVRVSRFPGPGVLGSCISLHVGHTNTD